MGYSAQMVSNAHTQVQPVHAHDCDRCQFVGHIRKDGEHSRDVYVCAAGNSSGKGREQDSLILRFSPDGPDYESFPVGLARVVATTDGSGAGSIWQLAVGLQDQWEVAGEPELNLLHLGDNFYKEFARTASGLLEESADGESYTRFAVFGVSTKVHREHVDHYVQTEFPATRCQHEHDCCGNFYQSAAVWDYVPGTNNLVVYVIQSSSLNV